MHEICMTQDLSLGQNQRLREERDVGSTVFVSHSSRLQCFGMALRTKGCTSVSLDHQIDRGLSLVMTTKARARKKKPVRRTGTQGDEAFCPGLTKEEKVLAHRKAQARYRARAHGFGMKLGISRNPDIRERQRVQAAEHRAAVKAQRRRWDPAKAHKALAESRDGGGEHERSITANSSLDSERQQSRMPDVGTTGSPSPEEQIAALALAELAGAGSDRESVQKGGMERHKSLDLVVQAPLHFPPHFSPGNGPLSLAAQAGNLPAGVTTLSRVQEIEVRIAGYVTTLTPVQSAQVFVADLNASELTPPTAAEVLQWGVRPGLRSRDHPSYSQGQSINGWRLATTSKEIHTAAPSPAQKAPDEFIPLAIFDGDQKCWRVACVPDLGVHMGFGVRSAGIEADEAGTVSARMLATAPSRLNIEEAREAISKYTSTVPGSSNSVQLQTFVMRGFAPDIVIEEGIIQDSIEFAADHGPSGIRLVLIALPRHWGEDSNGTRVPSGVRLGFIDFGFHDEVRILSSEGVAAFFFEFERVHELLVAEGGDGHGGERQKLNCVTAV
ncbi:hypothetical protein C8R47DRAFT_1078762 [Mycena vitilis]|nr:hypothetical protein C8R47DRAFT_1078762 [Mycena vitilis]